MANLLQQQLQHMLLPKTATKSLREAHCSSGSCHSTKVHQHQLLHYKQQRKTTQRVRQQVSLPLLPQWLRLLERKEVPPGRDEKPVGLRYLPRALPHLSYLRNRLGCVRIHPLPLQIRKDGDIVGASS